VRGRRGLARTRVGVELIVRSILFRRPAATCRIIYNFADCESAGLSSGCLLKIGLPAGAQTATEVIAWCLFLEWIMAMFATETMAANNFMMRYMAVSFMPAFGLSVAVTALVGDIYRHEPPGHRRTAPTRLAFGVTAAYMLSCGLRLFSPANSLIRLFSDDPKVLEIGAMLLIFAAVYQFFDAMYIIFSGRRCRRPGDRWFRRWQRPGFGWTLTVLGGWAVAAFWPGLGPGGPWLAATLYGILLGVFMYIRFRRGGWRKIHLAAATGAGLAGSLAQLGRFIVESPRFGNPRSSWKGPLMPTNDFGGGVSSERLWQTPGRRGQAGRQHPPGRAHDGDAYQQDRPHSCFTAAAGHLHDGV